LLEGLVDTIPVGIGKAEAVEVIKDHMTMADGPDQEYAMNSSIQTVLAEWNKVSAGIDLFNAEFGKLGRGKEKTREYISTTVFKIHDAIWDTDARAYLLAARIGRDNTMASRGGAKSVWNISVGLTRWAKWENLSRLGVRKLYCSQRRSETLKKKWET
jgi:hypothetical protein